MAPRKQPAVDRFWQKVLPEPNSGCWLWTAGLFPAGYAQFHPGPGKTPVQAHRFSYVLHKGPVPEGMELDHLCRVRCCVNPDHLQAVTHGENVRRSPIHKERVKTHCKNGHLYDEKNTYRRQHATTTKRQCRRCRADGMLRLKARRAAEQFRCL